MTAPSSVDAGEIAKFEAMAAEWWDPAGKFKPLHMINPLRLEYIASQIAAEFGRDRAAERPFAGLRLLDIGCGGGLLCEPMARRGADVMGADAGERNIPVARIHAEQSGLAIEYRHTTAEALADCARLLKPGGLMVASTINRNPKSFAMLIVGAEYVMRWLPRGTHDWRKFITPDELYAMLRDAGLDPVDRKGFVFDPLGWDFHLSARDLSVNYVVAAVKPG